MSREISFMFNGNKIRMNIEDHWTLLHLVREELGYTGTKEGCGSGECGACTVIVDGLAVNSCLYLAAEMNGIGACCVGGFHYDDAVDVFALTDGHYAAYAMLLGPLGPRIEKVDREQRPSPRSAIIPFPAYSRSDTNAST